jgi:predicted DNA-binding protein
MPTSIRLATRTERLVRRLAERHGRTTSEVIRMAIEALAREAAEVEVRGAALGACDRVAHVVGIADSGGANLSESTGEQFRDLLIRRSRGHHPR